MRPLRAANMQTPENAPVKTTFVCGVKEQEDSRLCCPAATEHGKPVTAKLWNVG